MDKKRLLRDLKDTGRDTSLQAPVFTRYILPNGHLDAHKESHALWYYYVCAAKTYYELVKNQPIV